MGHSQPARISPGVLAAEDLVYAHRSGQDLKLDLLLPADRGEPLPVALYFHGGGWAGGSRKEYWPQRLVPVVRSGIAVATVSYRLSGAASWPAQLDDAIAAVDFITASAADFGLDASRLGLWGASAGAHIALMTAFQQPWPTPDSATANPVGSVVAWFPPTELAALALDEKPHGATLPPFIDPVAGVPPFERWLVGAEAGADTGADAHARDRLVAASPLSKVPDTPPPVLLVHGSKDGLVSPIQSERLYEALRRRGGESQLLLVAEANHEDPQFDGAGVLGATAGWLSATR